MRVLVTGTAGRVGSETAREFLDHGYEVVGLDQNPPPADLRGRITTVYADLANRMDILRAADGCDAIAHLAAIPHPNGTENILFLPNVVGTQNIFGAAEAQGIKRVAVASTCCVFGIYFAKRPIDPQYLRMDEKHPSLPQDMYGLSKLLNEETAAAYTRRSGMTTAALRLTTVFNLEGANRQRWLSHALTTDERKNDMWTYVDTRDAARAFRMAIENSVEGTHTTAIIAARDSFTAGDIRDRVRTHFPALAGQIADLAPSDSLYDTSLAEKAFGWVAQKNWRDIPDLKELAK